MKAAFIVAREQIEVWEVALPTPEAGEILVRVRSCGICGSDLHAYRGELPARPHIPCGHEIAGEVAAIARDVANVRESDHVALAAATGCGRCQYCDRGLEHLCPRRQFLGMTYAGGMADYVRASARAAYKLPDGLDYELAALAEPLAVTVHGLHLAGLVPGERVLVLGAGSIGLLSVLTAKAMGAGEVIATYRYRQQDEAALALGADDVFEATDDGYDGLRRELGKRPADLIIETVGGQADTLEQAVSIAKPAGRILVLGMFSRATPLNVLAMALKEVRLFASQGYCRSQFCSDMELALHILASEPERAQSLISHRLPLEQAPEAFRLAADKASGSLKVQVVPS
jgi:L-iditol 2-dehydrogenase